MVQFLSIFFFLFLQFLLGFSKVPFFVCHSVYVSKIRVLRSSRYASAANTHQRQSNICSQNGSYVLSVRASQQTYVSEQGNKLMELLTKS